MRERYLARSCAAVSSNSQYALYAASIWGGPRADLLSNAAWWQTPL